MEYRLNPKTGVIYSKDEYLLIELNKEFFQPSNAFFEHWEDLELLPISTEEERGKLQYIYINNVAVEKSMEETLAEHYEKYQKSRVKNDTRIFNDILGDFVPSRNNVGRAHFSRDQEAD